MVWMLMMSGDSSHLCTHCACRAYCAFYAYYAYCACCACCAYCAYCACCACYSYCSHYTYCFLHRAADNSAIDVALWTDYGAFGGICSWPSRAFYDGNMQTAPGNVKLAQAQLQILAELKKFSPNISFPGLFLDIPNSQETPVATSFSNSVTSRFAFKLTVYLAHNVSFP